VKIESDERGFVIVQGGIRTQYLQALAGSGDPSWTTHKDRALFYQSESDARRELAEVRSRIKERGAVRVAKK